jgi:hypothetical protein
MRRGLLFVFLLLSLTLSTALTAQTRGRAAGHEPVTLTAAPDVIAAYNALSALEPAQRKVLYLALTPDVQAGVRRLQHQMYVVDHPELTAEQRAVLTAIDAHLTAEVYMPPTLSATQLTDRMELGRLHDRAAELFTPDEITSIFFQLGDAPGAQHNWRLTTEATCNCANDFDCGGVLGSCIARFCARILGCGFDGSSVCTGLCNQ